MLQKVLEVTVYKANLNEKCMGSGISKDLLADDHDVNKNIKKKYNEQLYNTDMFLLVT